ncbi:hypothetical protein D3C76_1815100 [compost metagenome]
MQVLLPKPVLARGYSLPFAEGTDEVLRIVILKPVRDVLYGQIRFFQPSFGDGEPMFGQIFAE